MKRIFFLATLVLISGIMFSCSDSSGSDTEEGYIDPGLTAKTVITTKSYSIAGTVSDSCASGSGECGAVIYSGELDNTDYVGIAADNLDEANPPTFKFKIYWQANSIPTGTGLTLSSCTIKISDNSNSYSATGVNVTDVDIASNGDGTYDITFNDTITVGGASITSASLTAYKY